MCKTADLTNARQAVMGVGKIFPGGTIVDFSMGRWKDFSRGVQNGEISFYPPEAKKTIFLLKI